MSKRDVIAALLRKANDPAATKAEAMAALAKAQEWANRYGLTLADIDANNEEARAFGVRPIVSGKDYFNVIDVNLGNTLSRFTCCKVWATRDEHNGERILHVFGHDADVELYLYLRQTFINALSNDWTVYKKWVMPFGADVKRERSGFVIGFCKELRDRIKKYETMRAKATGRDLVVIKHALVEQKFAELNIRLAAGGRRRYVDAAHGAIAAGKEAGRNVNIGRGVDGSNARIALPKPGKH